MEGSGWPEALRWPGNQRLERLGSVAPGFEVYQVGEGTFALAEPRHYEEVISYLILGVERVILLDTGMGIGNIQAEVKRLTELPASVVNSHSHHDHVGDNRYFCEVWAFGDDGEVARIERGHGPQGGVEARVGSLPAGPRQPGCLSRSGWYPVLPLRGVRSNAPRCSRRSGGVALPCPVPRCCG